MTVAAAKTSLSLSPQKAYHLVTAGFYMLMPAVLFLFMRSQGASPIGSLMAGVSASVFSPSALIDSSILQDLGGAISSQRLRVLSVYGEGPHVASLALQPLAVWAFWGLARHGGWWRTVVFAVVLSVLAGFNTPGSLAGVLVLACALLSLPLSDWKIAFARTLPGVVLGIALSMLFVPLSYWSVVFANNARMHGGFLTIDKPYVVYAAFGLCLLLLAGVLSYVEDQLIRFSILSSVALFVIVCSAKSSIFEYLPQAHRFHVEMEMWICVLLGVGIAKVHDQLQNPIGRAGILSLFLIFAVVCLIQMKERRIIDHYNVDPNTRVESNAAKWVDSHLSPRSGRIFTSGSTSFWFNAFSKHPQLGGCCDQGLSNDVSVRMSYLTNLASTGPEILQAIDLGRALGVQAFVLPNESSNDAYKETKVPDKFAPYLPRMASDRGLSIYDLNRTKDSLIHAVETAELVPAEIHRDRPEFAIAVHQFSEALQRESSPLEEHWISESDVAIRGRIGANESISVQMNYLDGWRLTGQSPAELKGDGLGLIVIDPHCSSGCQVDFRLRWEGLPLARTSLRIGQVALALVILVSAVVALRRYVL